MAAASGGGSSHFRVAIIIDASIEPILTSLPASATCGEFLADVRTKALEEFGIEVPAAARLREPSGALLFNRDVLSHVVDPGAILTVVHTDVTASGAKSVGPSTSSSAMGVNDRRAAELQALKTAITSGAGASSRPVAATSGMGRGGRGKGAASKPAPSMVYLKDLAGKTFEIPTSLDITVAEFKTKIFEINGVPEDQMRVIFAGEQLKDEATLSSYGVVNASVLHLVLKLRGD